MVDGGSRRYLDAFGLDRRRFLQSLGGSAIVGSAFAGQTTARGDSAEATQSLVAEQGEQEWELEPLSTGESIVEFYDRTDESDGTARTSLGVERSDVSNVFLFDDPSALTLGLLHDAPDDGSGGRASFGFDDVSVGDDGEWVLRDDPADLDGAEPTLDTDVEWNWLAADTDGGAFRGGLDDEFTVELAPTFHSGIDEWHLLRPGESATVDSLRAFSLDNGYSSNARTTDWQDVSLDLSQYAGQEVTVRLQADGRHTYNRENTRSWVQVEEIQGPGDFDETFDDLDDWTCENQPRDDGYDDTPTVGTCELRDGTVHVEEHSNRMRTLSTTVTVPESGEQTLNATVRGHVSAAWSHARLVVEVTEPTVERIQLDANEPLTIRRGQPEATPPSVVDVSPPPTAVETGEAPSLSVAVDPGSVTPSDVTATVTVAGSWRETPFDIGDGHGTTYSDELTMTERRDGTLVFVGELPTTDELPITEDIEPGFEYETRIHVTDTGSGDGVATLGSFRTYAFEAIDTVATIAARASDTTPERANGTLRTYLRSKAEYLNEYYASGLGSMGAQGFDVQVVNFARENGAETDAGWVVLPDDWDDYAQPDTDDDDRRVDEGAGAHTEAFLTDALSTAATDLDVDFDEYDTAMVTNGKDTTRTTSGGDDQWGLSRSVWRGEPAKDFTIPVLGREVDPGERAGMTPFETPSGTIDAMYAPMHVDTWLHEFGHSLGPDEQVGFPDLYDIPEPFANFGIVHGWGLMGSRDGKVISSFCRTLGSDPYNYFDGWLHAYVTPHVLDDVEVDVEPLTEKQIDDRSDFVVSAWANVDVTLYPTGVTMRAAPKLGIYVVEGRDGGIGLTSPDGYDLWKTPTQNAESGLQLYRFNGLRVEGSVPGLEEYVRDILEQDPSESPDEREPPWSPDLDITDADAIAIETMLPASGDEDEHTLADEGDTVTDPTSATTFELLDEDGQGSGTVELHRNTGELGDSIRFVADVLGGLQDLADDYTSGSHQQAPPPLDVMAETPDGRRAGVDDETGEVVNEIEGASVFQTPTETAVSVPRSIDVEFSVSAERLLHVLEDRDRPTPDAIEYERTIIDDSDLTVENRDGIAFLDGRITYTSSATIGDDEDDAPAMETVDVDLEKDRLNAKTNGNWVTATVGLPEGASANDLELGTVALDGVLAVSDEQYGFVKNPPTSTRDGRTHVTVKFPRDALVEQLGEGSHDLSLFGALNERKKILRGTTTVEVFRPGNGGKGN